LLMRGFMGASMKSVGNFMVGPSGAAHDHRHPVCAEGEEKFSGGMMELLEVGGKMALTPCGRHIRRPGG
jgi:hypothetical protein